MPPQRERLTNAQVSRVDSIRILRKWLEACRNMAISLPGSPLRQTSKGGKMAPSIKQWGAISALIAIGVVGTSAAQPAESAAPGTGPLTQSEHAALEITTLAACLNAQGWKVAVDEQGALDASVPFEQAAAYEAANSRCRGQFLTAHPRPVLDRIALEKLFRHQLFLVDCLKAKGYPPVQTIPSQSEYVAAGLSGKSPDFYAWSAVGGIGSAEAASLERACPQAPPGL